MPVIKRAWLSITRRAGKSLLLFLIVLILGNAIAGAIAAQQAAKHVENKIKKELGAAVVIRLHDETFNEMLQEYADNPEEMPSVEAPSLEVIQTIGQARDVKYYDYSTSLVTGSSELEAYVPPFLQETKVGFSGNELEKYYAFTLRGVHYHKMLAIEEGTYSLHAGRVFTEDEIEKGEALAIISRLLAEQNGIQIHDTVVLTHSLFDLDSIDATTGTFPLIDEIDIPVKVIGIIETQPSSDAKTQESAKSEVEKHQQAWGQKETANTIYMPNDAIIGMSREIFRRNAEANPLRDDGADLSEAQTWYEAVFVLRDSEHIERFKEENAPLLPAMYTLVTATDDYQDIAAPVEQMKKMAGYVLIAAIGASLLIVTLVLVLFLRERKHELGVYLSLGEKKANVVGQIMAEILMVALLGLVVSIFTGNLIASRLSNAMISTEIEQEVEAQESAYYGVSSTEAYIQHDVSVEDVVSAYEIRLTWSYILAFLLVSVGTIALSTLVPALYILRLRPRQILMST